MDNPEELYYQSLEDQYLQECAKFSKGDVVYFEHISNDEITSCVGTVVDKSIKTSVGIVIDKSTKKILKHTNNGDNIITIICYDIITPKNMFKNISECKMTSASEFIYHEYLKNQTR